MSEFESKVILEVLAAKTLYDVLGVSTDASYSEIKTAYRRRVLRCHPDKCPGDKNAAEAFDKIQKAFHILGDGTKRKTYDEEGETVVEANECNDEHTENEIREILIRLSCFITIPKDELLDDFVIFVRKLCESDEISEILMSSVVRGCFASVVAALSLPLSPVGYTIVFALGPAALGPAVAWEEVLAKFDNLTIGGRVIHLPLETVKSVTRTTATLTLMWSTLCVSISVQAFSVGITYAYNMATILLSTNASCEDLEEWLLITHDELPNASSTVFANMLSYEIYPQIVNGSEWTFIDA